MKHPASAQTLLTLGNAAELVCCVAKEVMGKAVSETIEGNPVSREMIYNMATVHFNQVLAAKIGSK